ncbi:MAG: 1-acyl-sn-glycerol-3-phosphate acyltransferase [Caldilineae bacterium]|nr:1-acyl-sn-glycerol-3-phosphate acyltransferase [Chloroflexota bacterium]MCB9176013.1 1-acyl-sn-glycerol-3-phosphate acyltransferase [Caldilineae bacterium]
MTHQPESPVTAKPDPSPSGGAHPINPRAYRATMVVLNRFFRYYVRTRVDGQSQLPAEGPLLVPLNHSSNLDAFVTGFALQRPAHFLLKVESTELPLIGRWLKSVGGIPAKRDKQDNLALREMMAVLKAGGLLGMTPEGTRSLDGRMLPYDPGFAWLALRTGATVVPLAIHGTHAIWPKGALFPRPGRVWCRFGEPFDWSGEGRASKERLAELAEDVRQRTLGLLAELAVESGLPSPAVEAEARLGRSAAEV